MGYSLIISARVEKELQAAVDYYDSINTELSEKFLAAVDMAFDSLIEHPQSALL